MSKIYIIGDSFASLTYQNSGSWVMLLSKKYNVEHVSLCGGSTQEIMLKFLDWSNEITSNDIVVLGISDPHRFYISDSSIRHTVWESYYKHFYNETISQIHYQACLNKIKQHAKEKNIKLLIFWSFPSDYRSSIKWSSKDFQKISYNDYIYDIEFDNEIRPALIYFSRLEVPAHLSSTQIGEFYANDVRPCHIDNFDIHKKIYNVVDNFYNNNISGQINLIN